VSKTWSRECSFNSALGKAVSALRNTGKCAVVPDMPTHESPTLNSFSLAS